MEFLKWLLCRKELETLQLYRIACRNADKWNASEFPISSATARWIYEFAEVKTLEGVDINYNYRHISQFRDDLRTALKDTDQ